jgi:UDP-N-acetylmuramoyl-tripeptide--D-alanyl-D-alanine ligase
MTKELVAAALASVGCPHKTAASINNETGVPLTLLGLRGFHDSAVIEMGMRGPGQIRYLCELTEPDVGVIVNAGTAHVGVVGSVEAIRRCKAEIAERLPAHGCAVVPAGDAALRALVAGAPRVMTFGDEPGADVQLVGYTLRGAAGAELELRHRGETAHTTLTLIGRHAAVDAACAVAAAIAAGVPFADAARGLRRARPAPLRGELRTLANRNLYIDCYNANPSSMAAAMAAVVELAAGRRAVAVVGDMLELGDEAAAAHREAGARAAALGLDVIALGEHGDAVVAGAGGRGRWVGGPDDAARALVERTAPGDWVLIKASRGMRLERVVDALARLGED